VISRNNISKEFEDKGSSAFKYSTAEVERALQESETKFKEIFNKANDAISLWELPESGTPICTAVNDSGCATYGYSREEFAKILPADMVSDKDIGIMHDALYELKAHGDSSCEVNCISKSGKLFPVEINSHLFKMNNKNMIVSVARDLSERKDKEKAVNRAYTELNQIFECAADGMRVIDMEGNIIRVNKRFLDLLDLDKNEVLGNKCYDVFPGRACRTDYCTLRQIAAGTETVECETEKMLNDGTKLSFLITAAPLRGSDGELLGIVENFKDIVARKQIEEALRENEERYRQLVELSPDAIVVHQDGGVVFANTAAAALFGVHHTEEIIGKTVIDYIHPDHRAIAGKRIAKVLQGKTVPFNSYKAIKDDGSLLDVEVKAVPFIYRGEQAVQTVIRDISMRKRLEEERLRAGKLESLGFLAGGIAHDFNNILTVMLGNLSLARAEVDDKSDLLERLIEAEKAALQAKDLTQQLLTFAKGGSPLKSTVSVGKLIEESISLALSGARVRPDYHISADLWPVEIDAGQTTRVINNIVINAVQAMPEGGGIEVTAENVELGQDQDNILPVKAGKYIKISISDQGVGIPDSHICKVFDPYFTTKQTGSGLGLATCYSIIKNHGGYITLESQIGAGTTVYVYLPASLKVMSEMEPKREQLKEGQGKILVMDDEVSVRNVVQDMLTFLGYQVIHATEGKEAVALYEQAMAVGETFEVVLLDLTIAGGMGGRQTVENLRVIDPLVKAIVSSGYSNDPVMADYQKYGFSGIVTKPYKVEELSDVINQVISKPVNL